MYGCLSKALVDAEVAVEAVEVEEMDIYGPSCKISSSDGMVVYAAAAQRKPDSRASIDRAASRGTAVNESSLGTILSEFEYVRMWRGVNDSYEVAGLTDTKAISLTYREAPERAGDGAETAAKLMQDFAKNIPTIEAASSSGAASTVGAPADLTATDGAFQSRLGERLG